MILEASFSVLCNRDDWGLGWGVVEVPRTGNSIEAKSYCLKAWCFIAQFTVYGE